MVTNIDIGIKILNALDDGDLEKLNDIFSTGVRNLNEVTSKEKWNWLHKALLGIGIDKPPRNSIEYLISKGVPINAQDSYGMTPLHYAMRSRNADAAIALLEAGADPNIPNKAGLRPLSMVGYTKDRLDVLELMLKKGANVYNIMGDGSGRTILESRQPDELSLQWQIDIYEMMKKYT